MKTVTEVNHALSEAREELIISEKQVNECKEVLIRTEARIALLEWLLSGKGEGINE